MTHQLMKLGIALAVVGLICILIDWYGLKREEMKAARARRGAHQGADAPITLGVHGAPKIEGATIATMDGTLELTLVILDGQRHEHYWCTAATALELGRALSIEGARATQPRDEGDDAPRARAVRAWDEREDARELLTRAVTCRACGLRWTWGKDERPKTCAACESEELETDAEMQRRPPLGKTARTCKEALEERKSYEPPAVKSEHEIREKL